MLGILQAGFLASTLGFSAPCTHNQIILGSVAARMKSVFGLPLWSISDLRPGPREVQGSRRCLWPAGLDPRFDITEIAAPYARGLLLEGSPQVTKARQEFKKGLAKQVCHLLPWPLESKEIETEGDGCDLQPIAALLCKAIVRQDMSVCPIPEELNLAACSLFSCAPSCSSRQHTRQGMYVLRVCSIRG